MARDPMPCGPAATLTIILPTWEEYRVPGQRRRSLLDSNPGANISRCRISLFPWRFATVNGTAAGPSIAGDSP
jgi:hypothetical protein